MSHLLNLEKKHLFSFATFLSEPHSSGAVFDAQDSRPSRVESPRLFLALLVNERRGGQRMKCSGLIIGLPSKNQASWLLLNPASVFGLLLDPGNSFHTEKVILVELLVLDFQS